MSDWIKREDAVRAVKDAIISAEFRYAEEALLKLPSAQPERKKGKWLPDTRAFQTKFVCSVCKESLNVDTVNLKPKWNFCPNCGAKME